MFLRYKEALKRIEVGYLQMCQGIVQYSVR